MVVMMAAVRGHAPRDAKLLGTAALGFMILCAGLTTAVHFVALTVVRRLDPASVRMPGYAQLFSWEWPSVLYALDILAWDWFFGLSMLLAAPIFSGTKLLRAVRSAMIASGTLSIVGLLALPLDDIRLRLIGVAGYGVIFPIVCLLLALVFRRTGPRGGESSPT